MGLIQNPTPPPNPSPGPYRTAMPMLPPESNVNPVSLKVEFNDRLAGVYCRIRLVPLIMVFPIPDPARIIPLVITRRFDPHETDPADTRTVSPVTAFVTQVFTLAKSGVAVQVGLDPVQAARTGEPVPAPQVVDIEITEVSDLRGTGDERE